MVIVMVMSIECIYPNKVIMYTYSPTRICNPTMDRYIPHMCYLNACHDGIICTLHSKDSKDDSMNDKLILCWHTYIHICWSVDLLIYLHIYLTNPAGYWITALCIRNYNWSLVFGIEWQNPGYLYSIKWFHARSIDGSVRYPRKKGLNLVVDDIIWLKFSSYNERVGIPSIGQRWWTGGDYWYWYWYRYRYAVYEAYIRRA